MIPGGRRTPATLVPVWKLLRRPTHVRHVRAGWHRPVVPRGPALLGLGLVVALVLAGCADRGPSTEVDDGSDSARDELVAPVFPDGGEVPTELVVEGLLLPGQDTLNASEILTKCPSKYEEVAKQKGGS